MKYKLLIIPILVLGLVGVFALDAGAEAEVQKTNEMPETKTDDKRVGVCVIGRESECNDSTSKERTKVKLESKKLEVCKKRQEVMKSTMTRMSDRSSKHIAWLDSVVEKVKGFYSSKGLTVANYDALVSNSVSARAAAVSSGNQLGQYQQEFSCDGNDPKSVINDFKTQHQSRVDTVKSYKEAVKALAEAVKAAAEASGQNTRDTTNTPTGGAN